MRCSKRTPLGKVAKVAIGDSLLRFIKVWRQRKMGRRQVRVVGRVVKSLNRRDSEINKQISKNNNTSPERGQSRGDNHCVLCC